MLSVTMDVEAEIRDLKRRVGEPGGSFGFLSEQVKSVHRDLLAFQTKAEQQLRSFRAETERRFDKVEKDMRDLREDLPGIVGGAVRGSNARAGRRVTQDGRRP